MMEQSEQSGLRLEDYLVKQSQGESAVVMKSHFL